MRRRRLRHGRRSTTRQYSARVGGAQLHVWKDEHHAKRRELSTTPDERPIGGQHNSAEECRREVVEMSPATRSATSA
jgi:hypothetical protein